MTGAELIAEERKRQIEQEGFTPDHDDHWDWSELVDAARAYALQAEAVNYPKPCVTFADILKGNPPHDWPWEKAWWKPDADPIRNLVKAGALIAAEIDRLQRIKKEEKQDAS